MTAAATNTIDLTSSTEKNQFVTFIVEDEEYGLPISKIKEIIVLKPLTKIPNMPSFLKGVINLRGKLVPIVDFRLKLGMPAIPYTKFSVMIIVELREKTVGLVVDSISDVLGFSEEEMCDAPHMPCQVDECYIVGFAQKSDRLVILLDVDKVLSSEEAKLLDNAGSDV